MLELLPRLRRYALTLATNAFDADDLLQATVERSLAKWRQLDSIGGADRWLFTIMSSIWKNELRAKAIRQGQGFVDPDSLAHNAFTADLEGIISWSEVLQKVSELPETQRQVILLVYVEGFKYEEAANILGIPTGTVMSRISRARLTLSLKLEDKSYLRSERN